MRQVVLGNTRSVVSHFDQNPGVVGVGADVHLGYASSGGLAVAGCVFQQVGDHAAQLHLVCQYAQTVRQVDVEADIAAVLECINTAAYHFTE